jgi:PBSX family phage terminase large subunit
VPSIVVPYAPFDVHAPFHRSRAYERHLFGAVGSGKTYAICAEAVAVCLENPGIRGLVTRRTVPELRDTTETVFFDVLPDELREAGTVTRTGGHYESYTFPNGAVVLFRSIDDWNKHKSLNLGFIAWDEMDEFDEETYIGMLTRLRQKDPTREGRAYGAKEITYRGTWGASNPSGRNWIWKRFIKSPTAGRHEHFLSTSFDNPTLPPDYFTTLLAMPIPWIKRYVLCQFDDFAGQIYEKWAWDTHVVKPYPLDGLTRLPTYPPYAQFWMGMDPGTRDPTGGLWVVVERTPQVRMVAVAEYLENDAAASVHTRSWRRLEASANLKPTRRIADPNRITVRDPGSNNRLVDQFRRLGYSFELGPSKYEDRIPALAELIENGRFVVTEQCPQTYEAIRDAKWKDLTPAQRASGEAGPEKPLKKERELCDCAEYLAGRWTAPIQAAPLPDESDWSYEIREAIKRKVKNQRPKPRRIEGVLQ